MDTFFGPYFHFCFELALETWANWHNLFGFVTPNHTHSLAWFSAVADTPMCLEPVMSAVI